MLTSSRLLVALAVVVPAGIAGWLLWPSEPAVPAPRAATDLRTETAPSQVVPLPPAAASVPVDAAIGGPQVVLSGVVVGAGGGNLAIVSVDRRPETMLRVGDELTPSATVVHIDDGSMTYRFAGRQTRVQVQSVRGASATAQSVAPARPLPGFVAGAPPLARPGGTEPGRGNDAFRQAVAKKAQAIAAGN